MPAQDRPIRPYRRVELAIFLAVIVLRLWVLSRFAELPHFTQQLGDMKFYHDWAVRILHGQWTEGTAFYGLPGYAFLLAGFYKVFGSNFAFDWLVLGAVQSVIEALTAVLVFKLARQVCESETVESRFAPPRRAAVTAGIAASAAYALFVPAQAFSIILMPTAWLVCAYWFCVWQALKARNKGGFLRWFGLGLLIGVVAMLIATILFAIPLLLTAMWFQAKDAPSMGHRLRRSAISATLLMAGVGMGTSPAWLHNYFVAHDPVLLSAHGGLNFWMGNGPGATGYPKIPEGMRPSQEGLLKDSIKWAEEAAGHPLKRTDVSRYWSAKAKAYIAGDFGSWLRLMGTKIRNFWNAFQYDDISVVTLLKERAVLLPGLSFGAVAGMGLAGILVSLWRKSSARWIAAAVLLHMTALLSVFITERYRLAAAPGLIILAVYALWRLWREFSARRWPQVAALALIMAAATLLTSSSSRDPSERARLWSLDPYNLGVKELAVAETLLDQGGAVEQQAANHALAVEELRHAEQHLRRAYSWLQANPGILFALGNLFLDRGDDAQARQWYQRTLALAPQYAGALKNLGYLDIQAQQWALADERLSAARAIESDNPTTCYLLAKAKIGLGDRTSARTVLEEALRMKPNQPEFLELQKTLAAAEGQP